MPWPRRELETARGLRRTPLYGALAAGGAVFGQKFGWERVNYMVPSKPALQQQQDEAGPDEQAAPYHAMLYCAVLCYTTLCMLCYAMQC